MLFVGFKLMNQNIEDDKFEEMIMRAPTPREEKTGDHDLMFKALSNPVRRKIIMSIGAFGKSLTKIKEETGIDQSLLNYHLDFLRKGEYIIIEDDTYRLTDRGLTLLSNV
jgi:predicted transcriptional regulator